MSESQSSSSKSFLRGVQRGTTSAAAKLDQQYRARLEKVAERGMSPRLRGREDPEDVVQSVLRTVFRRAAKGELQFDHSGALWRLLETVTRHKILKHAEHHNAQKRSPKAEEHPDMERFFSRKPTSADKVIARDLVTKVLEGLGQDYAEILALLGEGRSEREIAGVLVCTRSVVTRKLERLRKRLQKLLEED